MKKRLEPFDKYWYYVQSVQAPEIDAQFLSDVYKDSRGKRPKILREDFCGTAALCMEWVKLSKNNKAIGVDLDHEPTEWGLKNLAPKYKQEQINRIEILHCDVMDPGLPLADVIAAQNFSYFLFKEREVLKAYFQNAFNTLMNDGVFVTDVFGGGSCFEPNEEITKYKKYWYYWDQDSFNPITNEGMFYIHFKRKGEKKREKVFSYDWRMWSIPEIRDLMKEVGFKKVHVYWEGTNKRGEGDGNFKRQLLGDIANAWICYVVGEK